jgi:hypothetical protein
MSIDKKTVGSSSVYSSDYHYECVADMIDLLLSVYELSGFS